MKGFIVVIIVKVKDYVWILLNKFVYFVFIYDEEIGCVGVQVLVGWFQEYEIWFVFVIIGEFMMLQVIEGYKGCCEYIMYFYGCVGYGFMFDLGVNVVEYVVCYVLCLIELGEEFKICVLLDSCFELFWIIINIGLFSGGFIYNVIF